MLLFIVSCGRSQSEGHGIGDVQIKKSSLIADTSRTWEINHTLIISFMDGTPERKAEVELFSKEWTKYANINFEFYQTMNDIPADKNIDVLISFSKKGNNSTIGTDADYQSRKGNNSMSLSQLDNENINLRRSTILHEFGHVLGLIHEHQNIDRTFHLDENKTLDYCKTLYNFSEAQCRINIISTVSGKDYYLSKYDPSSIMHYSIHPGFFDNKITFRSNNSLSLLDKVEVAKIYPGRMSEDEIVTSHNFLMKTVEDTNTYNNCKINEQTSDKIRLNQEGVGVLTPIKEFYVTSLVAGEFISDIALEDKEGVIIFARNNKYCNMDAEDLRILRENVKKQNFINQHYGNCTIPLNEDGSPKSKYCSSEYPYSIVKVDLTTYLDHSCHVTFQSALEYLKKNTYCTQTLEKSLVADKIVTDELELNRKFGKCFVEDTKDINQSQCSKNYSWIISKINGEKINKYCFPNSVSAISFMKKEKLCKL